jgi:hypothetical protein
MRRPVTRVDALKQARFLGIMKGVLILQKSARTYHD